MGSTRGEREMKIINQKSIQTPLGLPPLRSRDDGKPVGSAAARHRQRESHGIPHGAWLLAERGAGAGPPKPTPRQARPVRAFVWDERRRKGSPERPEQQRRGESLTPAWASFWYNILFVRNQSQPQGRASFEAQPARLCAQIIYSSLASFSGLFSK